MLKQVQILMGVARTEDARRTGKVKDPTIKVVTTFVYIILSHLCNHRRKNTNNIIRFVANDEHNYDVPSFVVFNSVVCGRFSVLIPVFHLFVSFPSICEFS